VIKMKGNMEKQILNTADEAAKFVKNIEGWVDSRNRFWGKDEKMARWSGCTHIACSKCGKPTPKTYTICEDCREKKAIERYGAKECKPWDGHTPLYSEAASEYFYSQQDINDYSDYTENFNNRAPGFLRLVICEPIYLHQLSEDYFCDDMPEDGALPSDVMDTIEDLNEIISKQEPIGWKPGEYRVCGNDEK